MEIVTTTPFGGYDAAVFEVCVPAFAFLPRHKGGVRLLADGGASVAPLGPPL